MAFGSVGTIGTASSGTLNQASLVLTTGATAEAGNLVVVLIAVDNTGTTDADHSEISGVADSAGNTWTKAREFTNGQGTAQTGATVSAWFSQLANQLTSGGTITASFTTAASADATAMSAWEFTASAAVSVASATELAGDAADPAAITLSGLASKEYLFIHALAYEGGAAVVFTQDADYTTITQAGQGVGAAGMVVYGGFRILTGTGDTVDVATDTDRDHAQVLIALEEVAAAGGWGMLLSGKRNRLVMT